MLRSAFVHHPTPKNTLPFRPSGADASKTMKRGTADFEVGPDIRQVYGDEV